MREKKLLEAVNGVITLDDPFTGMFRGSTGSGEFPPIDMDYDEFSCRPTTGEPGILVFQHEPRMLPDYYSFLQYYWKNEKVIVDTAITKPDRQYCYGDDTGFLVRCRDWYYVTKQPKDHRNNYKIVDLFEMLRFIEGKIGIKELDRNARSVRRADTRRIRMEDLQERSAELDHLRAACDWLLGMLGDMFSQRAATFLMSFTRYGNVIRSVVEIANTRNNRARGLSEQFEKAIKD